MLSTKLAFALALLACTASVTPASAQPPQPAEAAATAWSDRYAQARTVMLAGDFAKAAVLFVGLAADAPDAPSRMLAAELASACQTWAAGGFVLAQQRDLRLTAPAVLEDRRTTDEISILYTSAVLYGLYAGVVVDVWAEADSPGAAIPPALLLAGGAAGAVALLDHTVSLRYGVAQSIVSGMYVGIEEAVAWALWHEASTDYRSEWGERAVMTLILGGGLAGATAGGIVGTLHGTTPGRAALMGSGAMWTGLVGGMFMGGLTGSDDTAMLSAAVLLNAGAVGAIIAGTQVSPSIARVRFIDLGGLSGGLLVGGLYWSANEHTDARKLLLATSIGIAAGLVTSWVLTGDMQPDQPRKRSELSFSERLVPTVAPASTGAGIIVGVGAQI